MKKRIAVVAGVVVALLLILVAAGVYMMGRPMYQPGMVRASAALDPPAQTAGSDFWDMGDGVRLHHFESGAGPNVLFLHGGPGIPTRGVSPGFERLAASFRIIFYDQRGCGRSTRPFDRFDSPSFYSNVKRVEGKLGLGAQVGDIERIRRILGDEKLILIGHSFGALLASLYAAEFPERVKAMVLVAPPTDLLVMPGRHGDLFATVRDTLPSDMKPEYDDYQKRLLDFRGIFRNSERDLSRLNGDFVKYYRVAAEKHNFAIPGAVNPDDVAGWGTQAMYFSMGRRHDYRKAMRIVKAPVLVVHGQNDLQSEASSRAYADAFPNARFAVIGATGHFPFHDRGDEFANVVGSFLRETK